MLNQGRVDAACLLSSVLQAASSANVETRSHTSCASLSLDGKEQLRWKLSSLSLSATHADYEPYSPLTHSLATGCSVCHTRWRRDDEPSSSHFSPPLLTPWR